MNENEAACSVYRRVHPISELTPFDNSLLCLDCLDEETVVCEECGTRIWNDDNVGDAYPHLCQRCYDRGYTTCVCCGRVLSDGDAYTNDEDDSLCYSCYEEYRSKRRIHEYHYKPDPIFYGTGGRYFGVELEVDEGGEDNANAQQILAVANRSAEHLYIKHDGSLHNGFEMVTHPMTLTYHQEKMPWRDILDEASDLGYRSHQASTCGLHIHVNRDSFGETEAEQDECIGRILYFFEKMWEELLKFSRRNRRQIEQWAARYGIKETPKDVLKHAKSSYGGCRYSCVNLCNSETIEFRIFRGTLRYNTVIATLQLVSRICEFAYALEDIDFQNMSWTSFVAGCSDLPELVQYLKERCLYINEPVSAVEEV